MSATGVTHVFADGTTETVSLDLWAQETSIYNSIRKLKFFALFYLWKQFRVWRNFVMQSRFTHLDNQVVYHPFFRDKAFFSRSLIIHDLQTRLYTMLHNLLLAFTGQRKFTLFEFEATNHANIERLKMKFDKFLGKIQDRVQSLYSAISDPKLVQVHDADFPDTRRRNPNLAQLMVLEKRKAIKRAKKTNAVNREIVAIGGFIRMIDYMLLESLSNGCIQAWRMAEDSVCGRDSSVFQLEVAFEDTGKTGLRPSLEAVIESAAKILRESIKTLNSLPRLLTQTQLRPFLRDNGLDLNVLFERGPQFFQIVYCSPVLQEIENHILTLIKTSFQDGLTYAQSLNEFYPIYKLGQIWDVRDYVFITGGKRYDGPLIDQLKEGEVDEDFLVHPELQPMVDFDRLAKDIERFRQDVKRIGALRSGFVKGVLHVDFRGLKAELAPIPEKALSDLESLLTNVQQMKIDKLYRALIRFAKLLKQEPKTLEDYVEFCELVKRTFDITPEITSQIGFIEKMFALLDACQISYNTEGRGIQSAFVQFQNAQGTATTTQEVHLPTSVESLKAEIDDLEKKLTKLHDKAISVPAALKDAEIDTRLPASKELVVKVEGVESRVQLLLHYQKVMGVSLDDFASYKTVVIASAFGVKLYEGVEQWIWIWDVLRGTPFPDVDVAKLRTDLEQLDKTVENLAQTAPGTYPILTELVTKISEIVPFLEQLDILSHGKLQDRHWASLFSSCNAQAQYHPKITIDELVNLGILRQKEQIEEIAQTAQGESELEAEFSEITNRWKRVQMPLLEGQLKTEESLLIGQTDTLLADIHDTLATLSRMLSLSYVQGIKDAVAALSSTFENLARIIEAWRLFQNNWIVLLALFGLEEARTTLPHQCERFVAVQRKWAAVTRHAMKDTHLLQVCSYAGLLDLLRDGNATMESIVASVGKFLDSKRAAVPRLYFLSNDEVLALVTATKFAPFMAMVKKMFMFIDHIDCHEKEGEVAQLTNLQRVKMYGMVGEDGDVLQFPKHVQCSQAMELWVAQLVEAMRGTVKDAIATALPGVTGGSFPDWAMSTPAYIATIALHVVFCAEMENCFATFETNPRTFAAYEVVLKRRIDDIADSFLMPLSPKDAGKLNTVLTILLGFRDRLRAAAGPTHDHSTYLDWILSLRLKQVPNSPSISLEYADAKWEHGYEFWGKVPPLHHTPAVDNAISDLSYSWSQHQVPILVSTPRMGKRTLLASCACLFGVFAFVVRPFCDMSEYFLSRILLGGVSCGAWIIFNDIESLTHRALSYIFDNVRLFMGSAGAGNARITISSRITDLNTT
jgi:hypothetical protein